MQGSKPNNKGCVQTYIRWVCDDLGNAEDWVLCNVLYLSVVTKLY